MRQSYLYRLFKHSVAGFLFVVVLLVCYAVTFSKKMNMVLFPYNSMYAVDQHTTDTTTTFAIKLNDEITPITNQLYWKKDFLETALNGYCRYIKHGKRVFLDDYLDQKIPNRNTRNKLLNKLVPQTGIEKSWPIWYVEFAGYKNVSGTLDIMEYKFMFHQNKTFPVDSALIQQIVIP